MNKAEKHTRKAAGEDPIKRMQIMDGARQVFMRMGYDAASMNDITREAGVSKGTIYVYFQNKEDLFSALVELEREKMLAATRLSLKFNTPIAETLQQYGETVAKLLTKNSYIRLMRILLGVIDRIPEPSGNFLSCMPMTSRLVLKEYLQTQTSAGLLDIDDCELASQQFMDLAYGGLIKKQLFCQASCEPEIDEIQRVVRSAVRLFIAGYGKGS
ncbi:TetR/AcrR family transcriptional regulator [Gynuella sp.]|uniref:TetR/AcrR family transcriptional regulator n=1 Tax=Gynuella sp. TaxID=2969146 RepID=UPI003D0A12F1